MTPYEILQAIQRVTKTPQPLKPSLKVIKTRLDEGFEFWQIIGYMEWLSRQTWPKLALTVARFCTAQNLSKWINDGEPLPHGSKLGKFKYGGKRKSAKALGEGFRLHATDLEMYLRCPKQLWFKMVKGPRSPAAAAFSKHWEVQVALTFPILPEDIEHRYQGDAELDFARRALERVRPALERLLETSDFNGYYIRAVMPDAHHGHLAKRVL